MRCWQFIFTMILAWSAFIAVPTLRAQSQPSKPPDQPSKPPEKKREGPINPDESGGTRGEQTEGDRWLVIVVKQADGVALPGADITITSATKKFYTAKTDKSGRASVGGLGAADYRLQVVAPDYESKTITVNLGAKPATSIDVVLSAAHGK
jgi:hypothetical protein